MRRTYSRRARCSQILRKSPNQFTTVCRMSRASSEVCPIISRPFCERFAYVLRHSHDIRTYVVRTSHKLRKNGYCRETFGEKLLRIWTLPFSRHLHPSQIVRVPREKRTLRISDLLCPYSLCVGTLNHESIHYCTLRIELHYLFDHFSFRAMHHTNNPAWWKSELFHGLQRPPLQD